MKEVTFDLNGEPNESQEDSTIARGTSVSLDLNVQSLETNTLGR